MVTTINTISQRRNRNRATSNLPTVSEIICGTPKHWAIWSFSASRQGESLRLQHRGVKSDHLTKGCPEKSTYMLLFSSCLPKLLGPFFLKCKKYGCKKEPYFRRARRIDQQMPKVLTLAGIGHGLKKYPSHRQEDWTISSIRAGVIICFCSCSLMYLKIWSSDWQSQ